MSFVIVCARGLSRNNIQLQLLNLNHLAPSSCLFLELCSCHGLRIGQIDLEMTETRDSPHSWLALCKLLLVIPVISCCWNFPNVLIVWACSWWPPVSWAVSYMGLDLIEADGPGSDWNLVYLIYQLCETTSDPFDVAYVIHFLWSFGNGWLHWCQLLHDEFASPCVHHLSLVYGFRNRQVTWKW